MNLQRVTLVLLLAAMLTGCSSLAFWRDDKPEVEPTAEATPAAPEKEAESDEGGFFGFGKKTATAKATSKAAQTDEHELKVARLWARVDEIEEEQLRQKERVRVLEKGLTLGLVPEELKTKKEAPPPAPVIKAPEPAKPVAEPKPEPAAMNKEEQERYQLALASAHDHYRAGRYGRAIVEYSDIVKNFGDKVDGGMSKYWVARCWINLKEYNTARQHLAEFLKEMPGSAWVPRAKLELARVEWKLGLSETALQRFRDVIQQHPYEDAAEMAKMELENLDKSL